MALGRMRRVLGLGMLACFGGLLPLPSWAQTPKSNAAAVQPPTILTVEQPDAQRIRNELSVLLDHYPPALRGVLVLDPSLLADQPYLAPYPALVSFLNAHPEIARNPSFYIGHSWGPRSNQDHGTQIVELWRDVLTGLSVFAGFAMGISLLVWLIRTLVDYRRWSRLAKVQTDVHTKLLDRFTANDDLLAYIQSPAGANGCSAPVPLAGPCGCPASRACCRMCGLFRCHRYLPCI